MTDQFQLTDHQLAIQDMARRFTADAITPRAAEWDEKHIFPKDTITAAAGPGFAAIYVSEASGGIGLGRPEAALIMEAMAYGCPSTTTEWKACASGPRSRPSPNAGPMAARAARMRSSSRPWADYYSHRLWVRGQNRRTSVHPLMQE